MYKKIADAMGVALLGIVILLTTLVVILMIRWSEALWNEKAAAWVQAVGSVTAIVAAYLLGERQAQSMLNNELRIKQSDLNRKNGSILSIAEAARAFAVKYEQLYSRSYSVSRLLHLASDADPIKAVVAALAAIPVHEAGSFKAVTALLEIRTHFSYLQRFLGEDNKLIGLGNGGDEQHTQARNDTATVIKMNCILVQRNYAELEEALRAQQVAG